MLIDGDEFSDKLRHNLDKLKTEKVKLKTIKHERSKRRKQILEILKHMR